jgi:hypothetical protein
VTIDGVWIGNRICWTHKDRDYKYYSAVVKSHTLHFIAVRTRSSPVVW